MSTSNPKKSVPADLQELVSRPPIYRLLGVAEKLRGKHLNHAWKGLAGVPRADEPGIPVVVKHLPNAGQIDIELACGLASQVLNLPVPRPALVLADLDDLPSRPVGLTTGPVLLFGSLFQAEDQFIARRADQGGQAAEYIWDQVCQEKVGPSGSAWDELVANPDRHVQNLLFDGTKWWLFDHNLALQPLSKLYASIDTDSQARAQIIEHTAKVNQLLEQVVKRRPKDHGVEQEAQRLLRHAQRLKILAIEMRKWHLAPGRISETIEMAALIVDLIALRLEPLALHIEARLKKPNAEALWDTSTN
ncbi:MULTISPECIES: hypothetical protein [Ralstonia]|uniref:Uncharacterized protein n=1 Tax=Ralstonia wenshanensis TaxID=2842456 RepID=A0AAD2ESN1_9RALS|nr:MULTISPECIES: hypothetical protein [Ralstonia]CAJ0698816.1 hypothetical protein LMG18091_02775 [Ralstonia wenshanensis]